MSIGPEPKEVPVEYDITKLSEGAVLHIETVNSVYRLEKLAGKTGLEVRITVYAARDDQPDYIKEGFETVYAGMSNGGLLTVLNGILKVYDQRMNMGFAFEAHPRVGRTHRLTSCVLRISDVFISPGADIKLLDFDDKQLTELKPLDTDKDVSDKLSRDYPDATKR